MENKRFFRILCVTVLIAFLTSLVNTVGVFADEGTPPELTEETGSAPETEAPAETEMPVEIEAGSTPEPEAQVTEETVAEVLESAPEGVDVVVLDESGEAIPLAEAEAVQIILAGDPIWCPNNLDGTPQANPVAGMNGCTPAQATFNDLLTELNTNPYSSVTGGTIFVAWDYASSEGLVVFDGSDADLANLGDLTIQGGWEFGVGMHNGDSTYQSTLTGTWLEINNWNGNVTINNLFIEDADGIGLAVNTLGIYDINLNEVTITESDLYGAALEAYGDVNVSNSEFNNNGIEGSTNGTTNYFGLDGLKVSTKGDVTLNNVTANNNGGNGAFLFTSFGNVEVNNSVFNNNGWGNGYGSWVYYENGTVPSSFNGSATYFSGGGLTIGTSNNISLSDITVTDNANHGVELRGVNVFIEDALIESNGYLGYTYISNQYSNDGGIEQYDFNLFHIAGDGILIDAAGDVTLIDVESNYNAGDGADIDADETLNVSVSSFIENGYGGNFFGGMCDSGFCGYDLLNEYLILNSDNTAFCQVATSYTPLVYDICTVPTYIEVNGANFSMYANYFNDTNLSEGSNGYEIDYSGGDGIDAETEDDIVLNQVVASGNGGYGADLYNEDGSITVTDSVFTFNGDIGYFRVREGMYGDVASFGLGGSFYYQGASGLYASAETDVTLQGVVASYNTLSGADVYTDLGSVFVSDSAFTYNGAPVPIGGEFGLFGDILFDTFGLTNTIYLPASTISVYFDYYEDISATILEAEINLSSGIGLEGNANGEFVLDNVIANENLGRGAQIFAFENIFVSNSTFDNNGEGFDFELDIYFTDDGINPAEGEIELDIYNGSGLVAGADGNVTLNNISASKNTLFGASIYGGNSVFIAYSDFSNNGYSDNTFGLGLPYGIEFDFDLDFVNGISGGIFYGSGLMINADGNTTLLEVTANSNAWDGAEVYSDGGTVTVLCGQYNNNENYGIEEYDASVLELFGPEITGNGNSPDEYFFSNSVELKDDCPIETGGSTSGAVSGISCPEGESKTFMLDNKDYAVFPCPINDVASASILPEDKIPAPLPDTKPNEAGGEYIYLSGVETDLFQDGKYVDVNQESMLISFLIPEGTDPETLTILYWDGSEWKDLGGEVSEIGPNGEKEEGKLYFQVSTQFVGAFVLAQKP